MDIRELLYKLAEAPPGPHAQIDETICARLKALADSETMQASDMKQILDDCAFASLASDFAMVAMNIAWQQLLQDEGTSVSQ